MSKEIWAYILLIVVASAWFIPFIDIAITGELIAVEQKMAILYLEIFIFAAITLFGIYMLAREIRKKTNNKPR